MSNQKKLETEGPLLEVGGPNAVKATPPSGGGTKKRWLRQAMSEDHGAPAAAPPPLPTPPSRPPPKKRRMEEMEEGMDTTPTTTTPAPAQHTSSLSTAEAAALLTRMGQPEGAQVPSSPPLVQLEPCGLASPTPPAPAAATHLAQTLPPPIPLVGSTEELLPPVPPSLPPPISLPPQSILTQPLVNEQAPNQRPELVKKRKKVSLDEYKKRKGVHGDSQSTDSAPSASGPPTPSINSFIPQMDRLPQSARLSHLPDPQSIGKGTATFEDLKARIYGRNFIGADAAPGQAPPPGQAPDPESEPQQQQQPPPPPPPPPKPGLTSPPQSPPVESADQPRMSLADRLRTEFGLEPEPEALAAPAAQPGIPAAGTPLVNGRGGPAHDPPTTHAAFTSTKP